MDFGFSDDERTLVQELRAWLKAELDPRFEEAAGRGGDEHWAYTIDFNKRLAKRGWLVPHWPKEYGGNGDTPLRQALLNEELYYRRAPISVNIVRSGHAGPTIIVHGSDEQKRAFLPPIARGEVIWCQGFSEPGAGSDLAGLQTRATADGDDFIINGQKIWTSFAHRADWCILLTRTDPEAPKHRGISMFLLDMKTPGITIRPLVNMAGGHDFNEVFFDNVRVPRANMMGEMNRGWYVATTELDFERASASTVGRNRRTLDDIVAAVAGVRERRGSANSNVAAKLALADLAVANEISRLLSYRVAWMQTRGLIPNSEASMCKLLSSELTQALAAAGVRLLGLYGALRAGETRAPGDGALGSSYVQSVAATVGGGTSEIQRNILATRGLGMPRG